MFREFQLEFIETTQARLCVRYGGEGPPVLLLHGHPRTHTTWHRVAPLLARDFTVVCPDLRGFGQSSQPADMPNHTGSSKRAKAQDCVELMQTLGHEQFAVVGHDRGSYTAFRAAMDHPERITKLAALDCIPIGEHLRRADAKFAQLWWHWFFFAQLEKPERAILADPDAWYGNSEEQKRKMGEENRTDYVAAIHNPLTVHGMLEDYRAGFSVDRYHDDEDYAAGRKVKCPTLLLWSLKDDLEELYGDPVKIWKAWAEDVRGRGIDSGHHMAEEVPEELADELRAFLGE